MIYILYAREINFINSKLLLIHCLCDFGIQEIILVYTFMHLV